MLSETQYEIPDLEDLAAYIDGRLDGERKAQVEERLLRDEEYHEVFLDTVRFQEEQAGDVGKLVVPDAGRWRRSWRLAVPMAAAAILAVAVGLFYPGRGPTADDWVSCLDAEAVLAQGKGWDDPGWSRTRGPGERPYPPQQLAFRLGVHTLHLRLALGAGDRQASSRQSGKLANLARDAGLLMVPSLYDNLDTETGDIDVLQAQQAEELLVKSYDDSPEGRLFVFGQWVEAGRLAALAGDGDAFARIVRTAPELPANDAISALVKRLESVLKQDKIDSDDFTETLRVYDEIVRTLAD
jgi:hypothetical protein